MKMPAKQTPPMTPMKKPSNPAQAGKMAKALRKGSKDAC
jgi:hypothetical protein